jgi:hypothetical protein
MLAASPICEELADSEELVERERPIPALVTGKGTKMLDGTNRQTLSPHIFVRSTHKVMATKRVEYDQKCSGVHRIEVSFLVMNSRVSRSISKILKLRLHRLSPLQIQHQAKCTSLSAITVLVVLLTCRLVVGFVLEFVKSAGLDGLHGLLFAASIGNSLLAQLSCILILIFVLFLLLFILFVYVFGRACTILRTRD